MIPLTTDTVIYFLAGALAGVLITLFLMVQVMLETHSHHRMQARQATDLKHQNDRLRKRINNAEEQEAITLFSLGK